jgi:hypothetical protein
MGYKLLISTLATTLLLMLMGSRTATAQPASIPAVGDSPAGELDDIKNEGERSRSRKAKKRRKARGETREQTRRREARRDRRSSGSSRARRAYNDHQRRRAYRSSRHRQGRIVVRHHHPRSVVVRHHHPRPVVVHHDPEPVSARVSIDKPKRSGLTAGWRHVGGGFGTAYVPEFDAAKHMGRFELGAGGNTVGLYGGGGLEVSGSSATLISASAVGFAGMALPIPVVHPLIGVKVGAGGHLDREGPGPHVSVGPQAGFILRPYDGNLGLRVMFDVEVVIKPTKLVVAPQAMLTFAGVF